MGRMVDSDDIIGTADVAQVLGLAHRNSVGTYQKQYPDFPRPLKKLGAGHCLLWLRSEVKAWKTQRQT